MPVNMMGLPNVPFLPKSALRHGAYYRGECRNASVARWNAERGQFYHWRNKWGLTFVETIKHPEDDEVYDVFLPFEEEPNPEREIPFPAQQ
jgi:hypothetical protein